MGKHKRRRRSSSSSSDSSEDSRLQRKISRLKRLFNRQLEVRVRKRARSSREEPDAVAGPSTSNIEESPRSPAAELVELAPGRMFSFYSFLVNYGWKFSVTA